MRVAVLGLLLANLVVFGWSQWLAPGAGTAAPVLPVTAGAPAPARILLAGEAPGSQGPAAAVASAVSAAVPTAGQDSIPAAGAAGGEATTLGAMPAVATPSGAASGAAATPASAGAVAATATPVAVNAALATPAIRCASMGPFTDAELTAQATLMLKQDGYEPRQRVANGAVPDGYMVVIRRLRDEADQARVVGRLGRGGLDDAFAIPKLDDGYAVSVGLFNQQRRAERRSQVVANMGFKPEILERTRPGTVYWLDFDLKTPATGDDPFARSADPSQKWQVVPCPGSGAVG
jgi:hypothetical protein